VANAETTLQQQIRLAVGTRSDLRLFRNQVGSLPDPRTGRLVTFGLARGSADLIGWRTVTITPDMVGKTIGVAVQPEFKAGRGQQSASQAGWQRAVEARGGVYRLVRSDADMLALIADVQAGRCWR